MSDNGKFSVDTEQLKNETKDTVNQVKDTIKNVDFKKDTEATKGFLKEMVLNPFETIKQIANNQRNILANVVVLMVIFIGVSVICEVISLAKYGKYSGFGSNVIDLLASFLNPIFYILVPAVVVLLFNTKNRKTLTTVICTLVAAAIPTILSNVIDVVEVLVSGISIVSSPISTALAALTTVFTYFGMKNLFGEEDDCAFFKKFAMIKLVAAFVLVVLGRIGIY